MGEIYTGRLSPDNIGVIEIKEDRLKELLNGAYYRIGLKEHPYNESNLIIDKVMAVKVDLSYNEYRDLLISYGALLFLGKLIFCDREKAEKAYEEIMVPRMLMRQLRFVNRGR